MSSNEGGKLRNGFRVFLHEERNVAEPIMSFHGEGSLDFSSFIVGKRRILVILFLPQAFAHEERNMLLELVGSLLRSL